MTTFALYFLNFTQLPTDLIDTHNSDGTAFCTEPIVVETEFHDLDVPSEGVTVLIWSIFAVRASCHFPI